MTAEMYVIIGIILSMSSAAFMAALIFGFISRGRKPLYKRRLNKVAYTEGFFCEIQKAYTGTGDIRSALALMEEQAREKGRKDALSRIARAMDYLENSRYKDYETALSYLSDESLASRKVIGEILEMEAQKQKRLPDKQMKGEQENEE